MRKNISLPDEVRQMLREIAKEDDKSESAIIQQLIIEEWDYRYDKQQINNVNVPED